MVVVVVVVRIELTTTVQLSVPRAGIVRSGQSVRQLADLSVLFYLQLAGRLRAGGTFWQLHPMPIIT